MNLANAFVGAVSKGYRQLTSVDASTSIGTIPAGTMFAVITPEAQAVRWTDDSTVPTAAVGYPLAVGVELQYTSPSISRLLFISQVAGAKVNIVFYGSP